MRGLKRKIIQNRGYPGEQAHLCELAFTPVHAKLHTLQWLYHRAYGPASVVAYSSGIFDASIMQFFSHGYILDGHWKLGLIQKPKGQPIGTALRKKEEEELGGLIW